MPWERLQLEATILSREPDRPPAAAAFSASESCMADHSRAFRRFFLAWALAVEMPSKASSRMPTMRRWARPPAWARMAAVRGPEDMNPERLCRSRATECYSRTCQLARFTSSQEADGQPLLLE